MKWLHLTDLHYRLTGEAVAAPLLRDSLLDYVRSRRMSTDYLFLTGDFRYGPDQITDDSIAQVADFIMRLAEAAGVEAAQIHYVPGNHDVARYENKADLDAIAARYDAQIGHFNEEDLSYLVSEARYSFYNRLSKELEARGVRAHGTAAGVHQRHSYEEFNLICLNTSLFCHDRTTDPKNLLIGTAAFCACLAACDKDKPLVLIGHHSLELLRDDERAFIEDILKDYASVYYLCGDAHIPDVKGYKYGLTEIIMGAVTYDGYASTLFCEGTLGRGGISQLCNHSWRVGRWAVDTHHNERFSEILKLDSDRLITKDEAGEFSCEPEHFVGREDIIAEIESELQKENNPIVLVNGIGGMGKTEICRVLLHRYRRGGHAQLRHIAWIHYNGDLRSSFYGAFHEVEATEIEVYWAQAVKLINRYGRQLLLILDNANELTEEDRARLNELRCHRLLTSRKSYTRMRTIALGQLGEEDCIRLYREHSRDREASDADILGLINLVDRHTLAIELLAKTQAAGMYSLVELRKSFEASEGLLPDSEDIEREEQAPYIAHLAKIFDISSLQQEEQRILQLFSLLAPNTPLSREHALALLEMKNLNLINDLTKRGWLQGASMHPLISATIRAKYPATPEQIEELSLKLGALMEIGNEIFTSKTALLPHAEQIIKQVPADNKTKAYLYSQCAFIYNSMANFKQALLYYKKTLSTLKKVLGGEHPDTASSYSNIGGLYRSLGDYENALVYCQKALAIQEKVLDCEHPDTATYYNNIGLLHDNQGDYENALVYYQKALAIQEKVLDCEHPDTATNYNNIGLLYDNQGDYENAFLYYKKSLAIRKKVLGDRHPDTATSYNNIGTLYHSQGNYEKALVYFQKSLIIREKVLGYEHPDTATSYNNIGLLFMSQGNNEKPLVYHQKSLAIREKVLGGEHPDTATSYNNIGALYQSRGDYEKALVYFQKSLVILEKVLGYEHPNTASTYLNIGTCHARQGNMVEGLKLILQARAIFYKKLGENHPHTQAAQSWIAGLLG